MHSFDYKNTSIWDKFEKSAIDYSDNTALIYLGKKISYAQLRTMVERLAASLYELGMRPGDKGTLYIPNTPQFIIIWLALQRLGCVSIPISPIYTAKDLLYMINDSEAETLFCMDTNFSYVVEIIPYSCLKRVVVSTLADLLPWWKKLIGYGLDRIPKGEFRADAEENIFTFPELLKRDDPAPPEHKVQGDDIAQILYTGGTTGKPKGVPFHHAVFVQSATEQRQMNAVTIDYGQDIMVQGGPLFHILGQALGIGALFAGDTLLLLPRVNIDALLYHIQLYKAKSFFGVPVLYRMILEHDRVNNYDISSLQYCFCAGDTLPVEVSNRWENKFGLHICQGYGTTESCGRISLTPANIRAPSGSIGQLTPSTEVKFVDPGTLEEVAPQKAGELLYHSQTMITSYWNKPEESLQCFIRLDGKLWYRTGDIIKIDEDGWLYYVDRSSDLIKHKGYRIAASEIENVLQEHHAVISACCVGIPDEKVGERIKAFVVLKEDVKGISSQDLEKWCKDKLAPWKVPQYIEFRDMLPKSKVGKLLRREIRKEEKKKSA
ncbi:MAG: AMP-binding protein [Desulfovermiculus sp.]|nr:AMP-binding protein [Desulfovermiculus sp.]